MTENLNGLKTKVNLSFRRLAVVMSPFIVASVFTEQDGARDRLPEPFDLIDHINNVPLSMQVGYATSVVIGTYYNHKSNSEYIHKSRVRTALVLGAASAGLAINSLAETRLGLNVLDSLGININNIGSSTPDTVDLAYGVIAAGAAAAVIPAFTQEPF